MKIVRNGGYTQILKLNERRGDNALMVILRLVSEEKETKTEEKKETKKKTSTKKTTKKEEK